MGLRCLESRQGGRVLLGVWGVLKGWARGGGGCMVVYVWDGRRGSEG